jgi:hypothetical protein
MPIPQSTITDLVSFDQLTANAPVAGVYFYWLLDCLVDVSQKIAGAFFDFPTSFTQVGKGTIQVGGQPVAIDIAEALAKLYTRYGADETIPNREQRTKIFTPLFGPSEWQSDDKDNFHAGRADLFDSVAEFFDRQAVTNVGALRSRVRQENDRFKTGYLTPLTGSSIIWSKDHALRGVTENLSYQILRSSGVTSVFSKSAPPSANAPYAIDPNLWQVVEDFGRWPMQPSDHQDFTSGMISRLQETAINGANALVTISAFSLGDPDPDLDVLIDRLNLWRGSIMNVRRSSGGGIVRETPSAATSSSTPRPMLARAAAYNPRSMRA